MKEYYKDYNFNEWIGLPKEKQIDIVNNYWEPYDPTIGQKTKTEIIENYLKLLENKSIRQIGIKNFGFYAVLIFVITDNPKQRIHKQFAGLLVNKGVIIKQIKGNVYKVKWRDGGHDNIDLTEKFFIG